MSRAIDPITATGAAADTSDAAKNRPRANDHPFIAGNATSVPITCVYTRAVPAAAQPRSLTPAAYDFTPAIRPMASASSTVKVVAAPRPLAMFDSSPPRVKFPASTRTRLVPADRTSSDTVCFAPAPSATIVTTAPTPMLMPSAVSAVRSLCAASASTAMRRLIGNIYSYRSDSMGSTREASRAG